MSKELDISITLVKRMLASWGSGSVHEANLRWALRELKASRGGGQRNRKRVYRVVAILSEVIDDQFRKEK